MPTERFYRLSDKKKQRIRDASMEEFTNTPLDKVSINRIIKEADISRGSFYTYFESKWDILNYLVEDYLEKLYACGMRCLEESGGNIWHMLESLLDEMLAFFEREERQVAFLKNVLGSPEQREAAENFWRTGSSSNLLMQKNRLERKIYETCAGVSLRQMDIDEFDAFFQLSVFSVLQEVHAFCAGRTRGAVQRRFAAKEKILRPGVEPKNEEAADMTETRKRDAEPIRFSDMEWMSKNELQLGKG